MRTKRTRLGLTLVELLVVLGVVSLVLALTVSVYGRAVRLGQQTTCQGNLRQLALGLNAYFIKHRSLPADDSPARFEPALLPFVNERAVFRCPAAAREDAASYAAFYVRRPDMDPRDFILGCPRHSSGRVATVLYGSAATMGEPLGRITHNGAAVQVGDRVTGGVLRFADGSVGALDAALSVDLVTSFERSDGSYYTILRIPVGMTGAIGLDVNPNSRLEVITPAAIAGSEGTRFYVILPASRTTGDKKQEVVVYVQDGKVRVTSRARQSVSSAVEKGKAVRTKAPDWTIEDTAVPGVNLLPVIP